MTDSAFTSLTRDHGRRGAESSFGEVTDRVCRWLLAVETADLKQEFDRAYDETGPFDPLRFDALRLLVEPARQASAEPAQPSADFRSLLERLQLRLGAALPPSLVGFWELRARSPQWRSLVDALVSPEVFAPIGYLDGHDESPIFRAGDDYEGYPDLLGTSLPQWLGLEIDAMMARLVAPDMATAVASGNTLLGSA